MATIRNKIAGLFDKLAKRAEFALRRDSLKRRAEDTALRWILASENPKDFNYPQMYSDYLFEWIRQINVDVNIAKPLAQATDPAAVRFATFLEQLSAQLPFAPLTLARETGAYADVMLANTDVVAYSRWI